MSTVDVPETDVATVIQPATALVRSAMLLGFFAGLMFALNVRLSPELRRSRKLRRYRMYGVRTYASSESAVASDYQRVLDSLVAKAG